MINTSMYEALVENYTDDTLLEKRIDDAIVSHAECRLPLPISVDISDINTGALHRVLAKYREGGWDTEVQNGGTDAYVELRK